MRKTQKDKKIDMKTEERVDRKRKEISRGVGQERVTREKYTI